MSSLGVGDCIAITDLLIKIVKVFKESGGAAEEYQGIEEHAVALSAVLGHLRTLEQDPAHQTPAALRQALSLCEKSLQQLCQRKSKYGPSLGQHARTNRISGTFRKIQWALLHSKDMKDLRAALNSEMIGALLMLAAQLTEESTKLTHQTIGMRDLLESLKVEQEDSFNCLKTTIERLELNTESRIRDATSSLTQKIISTESFIAGCCRPTPQPCNADQLLEDALASFKSSMEGQTQHLMRFIHVELAKIKSTEQSPARDSLKDTNAVAHAETFRHKPLPSHYYVGFCAKISMKVMGIITYLLIDALRFFWIYFKTLGPFVIHIYDSVQRSITLFRQPSLMAQDCINFLDALGRTHYLPFIFFQDFDVLKRSLRSAFHNLPGEVRVKRGFYVLHNMQTRQVMKKSTWNQTVFPGAKVGMSMLITELAIDVGFCPQPKCRFPFQYQPKGRLDFFRCPKCHKDFSISQSHKKHRRPRQIPSDEKNQQTETHQHDDISAFQRIQMLYNSDEPVQCTQTLDNSDEPVHRTQTLDNSDEPVQRTQTLDNSDELLRLPISVSPYIEKFSDFAELTDHEFEGLVDAYSETYPSHSDSEGTPWSVPSSSISQLSLSFSEEQC